MFILFIAMHLTSHGMHTAATVVIAATAKRETRKGTQAKCMEYLNGGKS